MSVQISIRSRTLFIECLLRAKSFDKETNYNNNETLKLQGHMQQDDIKGRVDIRLKKKTNDERKLSKSFKRR